MLSEVIKQPQKSDENKLKGEELNIIQIKIGIGNYLVANR